MKKIDVLDLLNEARLSLSRNWGKSALLTLSYVGLLLVAYFVLYLLLALCGMDLDSDATSIFELPIDIFLDFPLSFGFSLVFLWFVKENKSFEMKDVFSAFNNTYYWKSIGVSLLMVIYVVLWALLLIIPGIVKAMSYSMAMYIIAENPEMTAEKAIQRSMKMMEGHMWEMLLLWLIGVGLVILSALTLFIGMLWIYPWLEVTMVKFYLYVKEDYESRAVLAE
ncbi:MAG: DUF975 family protein [Paludibacteraceae bacterium]|nr:DUF975 family protein [Paludibacteraceae bacterium]